jgi:D-alanine-D-alanine ligase
MLYIKKHSHKVPAQKDFLFTFPVVLKPNSLGSSVGISICTSYGELCAHIEKLHEDFPEEALLITEYVSGGVEISCGCLQKKDGSFIKLPPIEIVPQGHEFFDYASKYDVGGAKEIVPPVSVSKEMSARISHLACLIHEKLGCSTYSRTDFIVKNDTIYFLETNTLPGFTQTSLLPQETAAIGMNLEETLSFILDNSAR